MILQKKFMFDLQQGLTCINENDAREYCEKKIIEFKNYNNYCNKQKQLDFLKEIKEMCDEDIKNIDFDLSSIQYILYYDQFDKRNAILFYDMILLGKISFNVFDYGGNALKVVVEGENGPISTKSMVEVAYNDLVNLKRNNQQDLIYGSLLILVTLLESELRGKIKKKYIDEKITQIEQLSLQNKIQLSNQERWLIDSLEGKRQDVDRVFASTRGIYNLLKDHNLFNPSQEKDIGDLLLDSITLNKLLNCNYVKNLLDDSFLSILKIIFGRNQLNLRNSIAHVSYGYIN